MSLARYLDFGHEPFNANVGLLVLLGSRSGASHDTIQFLYCMSQRYREALYSPHCCLGCIILNWLYADTRIKRSTHVAG